MTHVCAAACPVPLHPPRTSVSPAAMTWTPNGHGPERPGSVAAWRCDACGAATWAVHLDGGAAAPTIKCRATEGCTGHAHLDGYPTGELPLSLVDFIAWEWYLPTPEAVRAMVGSRRAHCAAGGLDLRPVDAGRALLPGGGWTR